MPRISRTDHAAGFTLIEMLTVLTVIALLSVIFAGRMPRIAPSASRAAGEVARSLRDARSEAVTTGRDVTFEIEESRKGRGRSPDMPEGIEVRLLGAGETPIDAIVFFGAGGSTGGTVEISRGEAKARIAIDWLTGSVRDE